MWLHIGELSSKQLLCAVDSNLLNLINEFTPAVIAFAWKPLRVLVSEYGTGGFEHCLWNEILTRNYFQAVFLASCFFLNQTMNFWIEIAKAFVEVFGSHARTG